MLQDIGIKWNTSAQGPSFQVIGDAWRSPALRPGGAADGSALEIRPRIWPFASSLSIASSLASMINLLVQNGDAVILAEPCAGSCGVEIPEGHIFDPVYFIKPTEHLLKHQL